MCVLVHNINLASPQLLRPCSGELVSWCFKPSQPQRITSGLLKELPTAPGVPRRSPCSGELRPQKLKSHLLRTQNLKVLSLKPGVFRYLATHATLTARDFFLANFYHFGPFTCIFSNLSRVFHALAVANTSSGAGPQNTIGHPAHRYGQLRQVLSARGI